jgi:outer membrane protein assembly factor BamB
MAMRPGRGVGALSGIAGRRGTTRPRVHVRLPCSTRPRRARSAVAAVLALTMAISACGGSDPARPTRSAGASGPAAPPAFDPPLAFAANAVQIQVPSGMFQVQDAVAYLLIDKALAAYDLSTGTRRWSTPLTDPPVRLGNTRPMIAQVDGELTAFVVYRVLVEGSGTVPDRKVLRVASFRLADGKPGWQSDVDDKRIRADFSDLGVDKVVAASADHVVVSTDSYDIGGGGPDFTAVLDARTGKVRWANPEFQARALDGDIVAGMVSTPVSTGTPASTAGLAAANGSQLWVHEQTRPVGELVDGPLGGGLLLVGRVGFNSDGPNGIIEVRTGREVIHLDPVSGGSHVCRYDDEGIVVCAQHLDNSGGSKAMAAYDTASHKRLWQLPDEAAGREAPMLSAARRGMVYGSTSNGPLILDARTGQDKVTDLGFTPEVVVAGFAIEWNGKEITVHPATG